MATPLCVSGFLLLDTIVFAKPDCGSTDRFSKPAPRAAYVNCHGSPVQSFPQAIVIAPHFVALRDLWANPN